MPAEDMERMKKFYETSFGWKTQQMGADFGDYVVVQTAETDEKGMLKETNRINGGFYKKTPEMGPMAPSVVIAVENIQEAMKKVTAAGGKVIGGGHKAGEPDDIPGIGLYISVLDTEGNRVGMLQPSAKM